jgi:hypothetical protein
VNVERRPMKAPQERRTRRTPEIRKHTSEKMIKAVASPSRNPLTISCKVV